MKCVFLWLIVSSLCGVHGASWTKVISTPVQPEVKLGVVGGVYQADVAQWDGLAPTVRTCATPEFSTTQALDVVWLRNGQTVRREIYPLPDDAKAFEHALALEHERIEIPITMKADGKLTVVIEDEKGIRVRNLVSGVPYKKGAHVLAWDGYDEEGALVAPKTYRLRIAQHPGLSYDYKGYFMCGGEQDQWNPWGPNHSCFCSAVAQDEFVALGAPLTEGGQDVVVLQAKTGKLVHGYSFFHRYLIGAEGFQLVAGNADRFYAVYGNPKEQKLYLEGYGWRTQKKIQIKLEKAPPTLLAHATTVGNKLYVLNRVSRTLDCYVMTEQEDLTRFTFEESKPAPAWGAMMNENGKLAFSPTEEALALTGDENCYYTVNKGSSVIHVYEKKTLNELTPIGSPYGFQLGAWNKNALVNPTGLTRDQDGFLWVTENRFAPKRVSKWDSEKGVCVYEKFGPTTYGHPNMGMNPKDPTQWMAYNALWHYDEKTGEEYPVACVLPTEARRRQEDSCGAGVACESLLPDGMHVPTAYLHYSWFTRAGRTFVMGQGRTTTLFELVSTPMHLKPLAALMPFCSLGAAHLYRPRTPSALVHKLYRKYYRADASEDEIKKKGWKVDLVLWKDLNGDECLSEEEIELLPGWTGGIGYWGFMPEALDFGMPLYSKEEGSCWIQLHAGDMKTKLPGWNLKASFAQRTPIQNPYSPMKNLGDEAITDRHGNCVTIGAEPFMYGISKTGECTWRYANPFTDVHGSHKAGLPQVGSIQGVLFNLGCVPYSKTADVMALQNNYGRIFFLTTDGLYLDELFTDSRVSARLDEGFIGGEPFGGSFQFDEVNRRAILQAGGYRWYVIQGLDRVEESRGTVCVTAEQLAVAAQKPFSRATNKTGVRPRAVVGSHRSAVPQLKWSTGMGDVTVKLAATEKELTLVWHVQDASPWKNEGQEVAYLFKTGDSVDVQYLDEKKEPCRLLIAPHVGDQKKSRVVLYRHHAKKGNRMGFSSPARTHWVGDVSYPTNVATSVRLMPKGYEVTAHIPRSYFGAQQVLTADVGVIFGDEKGQVNLARSYWSNKDTGLVNDVPGEIAPQPKKWGTLQLEDEKVKPLQGRLTLERMEPLVNPAGVTVGGYGPVPNFQFDTSVGPYYDAVRHVIYVGAGYQKIVAWRLDGEVAHTWHLPGASAFAWNDSITQDDEGKIYVLAGSCLQAGFAKQYPSAGRVYRLDPDMEEVTLWATNAIMIASQVVNNQLLLARRVGEKESQLVRKDVTTGEEKEIGRVPYSYWDGWTMMTPQKDGSWRFVLGHNDSYDYKNGVLSGPTPIFGARELHMTKGYLAEDLLWTVCGNTVKRLDANTFAPRPGVVLGGASGWMISSQGLVNIAELDACGICPVEGDVMAVASGRNGALYLTHFDAGTQKMAPIRRLGPLPEPNHLLIDPEGFILCDGQIWHFSDAPFAPARKSIKRWPERAAALLPTGVTVEIQDHPHTLKPQFYAGRLSEGLRCVGECERDASEGNMRRPNGARKWAQAPARVQVVSLDKPNQFEIQAIMTNGLVRCYRVTGEGRPRVTPRTRTFQGEAPDVQVNEAVDGPVKAVTDTLKGTLTLYTKGAQGAWQEQACVRGLKEPTHVALACGRLVVYERGAQRVLRFRVVEQKDERK